MHYRKKSVVVEAMVFGETAEEQRACADWVRDNGGTMHLYDGCVDWTTRPPRWTHAHIDTLEGGHSASIGDYIIRGVVGEFYPCKPDIFAATYEPVEP